MIKFDRIIYNKKKSDDETICRKNKRARKFKFNANITFQKNFISKKNSNF